MNKDYENNWEPSVSVHREPAAPAPLSKNGNAIKQIVTIRLDVDMLEWFKADGPGYQTRINQVLREHMTSQQRVAQAAA